MKFTFKKIMVIAMLWSAPFVASAKPSVWSGWYPVKEVYTYWDGRVYIKLDPSTAHSNPAECSHTSWLVVLPEQLNVKEIYQMALTAQAAGLKVNANILGTECAHSAYPRVIHMRTKK